MHNIAMAVILACLATPINSAELRLVRRPGPTTGGAVLDLGGRGTFDAAWVSCPSVLESSAGYRMWYSSFFDSKMGRGGIGLAVSGDGVNWRRVQEQPVFEIGPAGAFDDGQVLAPEVHYDGEVYRMWYTGMARQWHASGFGFYRIGLATSRDGIHWQRANGGRPVLDVGPAGSPDEVQAATPSILREGDGYRMWYAAWSPRHNHTICTARSRDGVVWQREEDGRPVEGLSPAIAYGPAVARVGEEYLLLYMALKAEPGLYAARSKDGRRWAMLNGGRPVLAPARADAFDAARIGHPFILGRRVWYAGYRREAGRGLVLRIGLAEVVDHDPQH